MTAAAIPVQPSEVEDTAQPRAWYTLWALLATILFAFVDRQIITLVAAPMAADIGLSDTELGMIQGLPFTVFAVLAIYPIAWLADRFDPRIILSVCIVIWSLGTLACGFAQSFEHLFAACVAIAAGEAGIAPIVLASIPRLFSGRKRVTANFIYYIAALLGVSLGMLLGGGAVAALDSAHDELPAILRTWESWRLAFVIVALPAPLFLALAMFMRLSFDQQKPQQGVGDLSVYIAKYWREVLMMFGGIGLSGFAYGGVLAWVPVANARLFGATPAENGAAFGIAMGVATLAGVAIAGVLMRPLTPKLGAGAAALRIAWIAILLACVPMALFGAVSTSWQAYALVGLLLLAGTIYGSLTPNLLQDVAPSHLRGRVMAIYSIIAMLVGGGSVWLVGFLSDNLAMGPRSLLYAIVIAGVPSLLASGALLRIAERRLGKMIDEIRAAEAGAQDSRQS